MSVFIVVAVIDVVMSVNVCFTSYHFLTRAVSVFADFVLTGKVQRLRTETEGPQTREAV